jgi:peptide/nickel transport system permease protein
MAIVLVTHDWGVLSDLCERAIVMYAGQVVEQGTVAELVERPRHPYTAALLAASPHEVEPGTPLLAIEGSVPAPEAWPTGCRFQSRCTYARADCGDPIPLLDLDIASRRTRCIHHDEIRSPASLSAVGR